MLTNGKRLINQLGITASVEYADSNPNMSNSANMNHFRVTLRRSNPRRQLTSPFSQGYGISGEPTADSVLQCLISDAQSADNARDFEDFASEFGYDSDSRTAERTYKACQRTSEQLKRFLGSEYDNALSMDWDEQVCECGAAIDSHSGCMGDCGIEEG